MAAKRNKRRIDLSGTEFCKKHKVDYTGTWCGGCVLLWQKHSKELKKLKAKLKDKPTRTRYVKV